VNTAEILKGLEEDAVKEFEHYHVPQLAKQFLAGYAMVLVGSLASSGWHVAGWAALWSLLGGAAAATVEKLWPTVPWGALLQLLRDTRTVATPAAPPPAAAPKAVTRPEPPTIAPKTTG
jgi:fatty acid desaturase